MKEKCKNILELIIGEKECKKIITKTAKKYNKGGYSLNNFETIMESYFIAILLIGFSKKKVGHPRRGEDKGADALGHAGQQPFQRPAQPACPGLRG